MYTCMCCVHHTRVVCDRSKANMTWVFSNMPLLQYNCHWYWCESQRARWKLFPTFTSNSDRFSRTHRVELNVHAAVYIFHCSAAYRKNIDEFKFAPIRRGKNWILRQRAVFVVVVTLFVIFGDVYWCNPCTQHIYDDIRLDCLQSAHSVLCGLFMWMRRESHESEEIKGKIAFFLATISLCLKKLKFMT